MHTYPTELNGFPVVGLGLTSTHEKLRVLVHREGHAAHPWVVATWYPHNGSEWLWGHYCESREQAKAVYPDANWIDTPKEK